MGSYLLVVCLLKRRNQYTLAVYLFYKYLCIFTKSASDLTSSLIPRSYIPYYLLNNINSSYYHKQKKWAAKRKKHTKELISMGSKNLVVSKMMKSRSSKYALICLTSKTKDFYQLTT